MYPKTGRATNPEQLFAAGYAACFHSAMHSVARSRKITLEDTAVGARVSIGPNGAGGFEIAVELEVSIPHLPQAEAQELADAAQQVCPIFQRDPRQHFRYCVCHRRRGLKQKINKALSFCTEGLSFFR